MRCAIDWVDVTPTHLEGTVASDGPSMRDLVKELETIPIEVLSLKNQVRTEAINIKFPKNFSKARKEDLAKEVVKLYPRWKVKLEARKGLEIEVVEDPAIQG